MFGRYALSLCLPVLAVQVAGDVLGKPLTSWLRDLRIGTWYEAKVAAGVVARLGPEAKPAVPALIKALRHDKARHTVIDAIGRIGPAAIAARNALLRYRKSADRETRRRVWVALDRIGVDLVRVLVNDLRDPAVRRRSIDTLGALEERGRGAAPNLVAILGYVVKPLPRGMHRAEVRRAHAQKMLRAVMNRRSAATALGRLRVGSWRVCSALTKALGDPDRDVARRSLASLVNQGGAAIPFLIKALDADDVLASGAAAGLRAFGPDAAPALGKLRRVARSKRRPTASKRAGEAVVAIEKAVRELARAREAQGEARRAAIVALAPYGSGVADVVAAALGEPDVVLQRRLLDALLARQAVFATKLTTPRMPLAKLVSPLIRLLRSPDARVATRAARALHRLGARAPGSAIALTRAVQDPRLELRIAAALALSSLGAEATIAVPHLVDALADEAMLESAGTALAAIGRNAVPALREALASAKRTKRLGAALVLRAIGHDAFRALPELGRMAESGDAAERAAAKAAVDAIAAPR